MKVKSSLANPTAEPESALRTGAILVAAGSGERFRGDKQSALLDGKAVLLHSLDSLNTSPFVHGIVVVLSDSNIEHLSALVHSGNYEKVRAIVKGGGRRQDSVFAGITALEKSTGGFDLVLVHDGARPFIDHKLIRRSIKTAARFGTAIAAMPVRDTIKTASRVGILSDGLTVEFTPERSRLYAAQTPQVFRWELLKKAHAEVSSDCTDDAAMAELAGVRVVMFEGSYDNVKITQQEDMAIAKLILTKQKGEISPNANEWRWGTGFDCHHFGDEGARILKIGGAEIDFPLGLEGHSDGDVLFHAAASAVLGGAGIGDLGQHFPSSDKRWKNADSGYLLRLCAAKALAAGWEVRAIDSTVIAQKPRLAEYQGMFEANIGKWLELPAACINAKVTSTDKLGAVGLGKGIAAEAIATMKAT